MTKIYAFIILGLVIIAVIIILIIIFTQNSPPTTVNAWTGINNCLEKIDVPTNSRHYTTRTDCQRNSNVQNGYKFDENGICVATNSCKISDDDCFLTQYGCWKTQNPKRWRCDVRGNGCVYTACNINNPNCFDTEKKCQEKCNFVCSLDNACIQNQCKISDPHCFSSLTECSKKCKNVKCDTQAGQPLNSCTFNLCENKKCRESDINKQIKECASDCAIYKCNNLLKQCYVDDGSLGPICNPLTDSNCYQGIDDCLKKCDNGNELQWGCNAGTCFQLFGSNKERKDACKNNYNNQCFKSIYECQANCGIQGYNCWDNCKQQSTCTMADLGNLRCFTDKKQCKNACKNQTYSECTQQECITLPKHSGCDLINNPNCYPNNFECQQNCQK